MKKQNIVFVFPGQGSYNLGQFKQLVAAFPEYEDQVKCASDICQAELGFGLEALLTAATNEEVKAVESTHRDIDQVVMFLTNTIMADVLIKRGIEPGQLIGHSMGELSALCTADVYSIATGVSIVCDRVASLGVYTGKGRMASLFCDVPAANDIIGEFECKATSISVVNHSKQVVVSGPESELRVINDHAPLRGISCNILPASYPFHSPLLNDAVDPFRQRLNQYEFRNPAAPMYLGMEGRFLGGYEDLTTLLATQFVKTLDFQALCNTLDVNSVFIECGASNIVSKLLAKNIVDSDAQYISINNYEDGLKGYLNTCQQVCVA